MNCVFPILAFPGMIYEHSKVCSELSNGALLLYSANFGNANCFV